MLRLWRTEWFERTPPVEEVDFGNGRRVSTADLLDGHAHRLIARSEQRERVESQTISIQVNPELQTSIHVVAPTLTPLTELAEEVAQTMPNVEPTPYFRDTLNKALTQTHRQHHAQRLLGIRPTEVEQHIWRTWLLVSVLLTAISLSMIGLQHRTRTQ